MKQVHQTLDSRGRTGKTQCNVGGDFAVAWESLRPGNTRTSNYFNTGRDAFAAILMAEQAKGQIWLVPDFICPIVPKTLTDCGAKVRPYRFLTPWDPDYEHLKKSLVKASGIVVPFYMGLEPDVKIWELLDNTGLCVVEDRCLCVGRQPCPNLLRGHYAIGSFRKWMATPDGAFCVKKSGRPLCPTAPARKNMVQTRLAAALTKHVWQSKLSAKLNDSIEGAFVTLFHQAESNISALQRGCQASFLAEGLIENSDFETIASRRVHNQSWLCGELRKSTNVKILEPWPGAMAKSKIPLLCVPVVSKKRDALRRQLAGNKIYCAVHWTDGDWSNSGDRAAWFAKHVLSLPIDQRYGREEMKRILDAVA